MYTIYALSVRILNEYVAILFMQNIIIFLFDLLSKNINVTKKKKLLYNINIII